MYMVGDKKQTNLTRNNEQQCNKVADNTSHSGHRRYLLHVTIIIIFVACNMF